MRGNIPFLKQNRYTLQKNKCKILLQRKRSWKFLWEDRCKYKIEYHFKGRIHKGCYKYLKQFTNSKFLQDFVQISSKFFYKTIVLALQKMYLLLLHILFIPLKAGISCHDMHINLKALKLGLYFLFILNSTLSIQLVLLNYK